MYNTCMHANSKTNEPAESKRKLRKKLHSHLHLQTNEEGYRINSSMIINTQEDLSVTQKLKLNLGFSRVIPLNYNQKKI